MFIQEDVVNSQEGQSTSTRIYQIKIFLALLELSGITSSYNDFHDSQFYSIITKSLRLSTSLNQLFSESTASRISTELLEHWLIKARTVTQQLFSTELGSTFTTTTPSKARTQRTLEIILALKWNAPTSRPRMQHQQSLSTSELNLTKVTSISRRIKLVKGGLPPHIPWGRNCREE